LPGSAILAFALALTACSGPAPTPSSTPSPAPTPSPTPELLFGQLTFADASDRQVPADGISVAKLVAKVTDSEGSAVAGRAVEVHPLGDARANIVPPTQTTDSDGSAAFEVASNRLGQGAFGLYVSGQTGEALAQVVVDFTRKVVVLAPGFQSALVRRFAIFGTPSQCVDPAKPGSISEALICLGYTPNAADDPSVGTPTPGATILDMSWEAARCTPSDPADATDCVATISPSPDGSDVVWQPADYDLATLAISMVRQSNVDVWARRLANTLQAYDDELSATTNTHASFYLVGHSLGGEVVVRLLRAVLADPDLAVGFEGDSRGRLKSVISVDGALNWTGGFDFGGSGARCGIPAHTTADKEREADNVDAVEQAFDHLGTETIAITAETDPVVGPEVALLEKPLKPQRGYFESVFSSSGDCAHSSLLRPEPGAPVTYPLNDIFIEHIGPAAGR
jgi:hypothetical protein